MDRFLRYIGIAGISLAGLGSIFTSALIVVPGGHRAVVFDRLYGVKPDVLSEGMNLVVPLMQKTTMYEVRTRWTSISSETGSKDLQTVGLTLRLLYRPVVQSLPVIHQRLGPDYDERVLPPLGNEVLKAVVAQYDASELITQREFVSSKIRENLTARASEFNISLEDVSITHVSFSPEFTHAIESKQVAQQEAERSKFVVVKAEQERKAAVIRASGEAEAAKLIIDAMQSGPGFIELRKIEAAREIAETLSKSRNVIYLPSSAGGSNLLLNLGAERGSHSNSASES